MKKFLLLILLLLTPSLLSCVDSLEDYYEVHSVVIDGVIYRYIDPSDGKSTFRRGDMNSVGTYFLYIYHKVEGETFDYDKFFMPAYDRFIETSTKDKLQYTLANDDIDQWMYQYWLDYEVWKEENKKE